MDNQQQRILEAMKRGGTALGVLRPQTATVYRTTADTTDDLGSHIDDHATPVGTIPVRYRQVTGREAQNVTGTDSTLGWEFVTTLDADVTEADELEYDGDRYNIIAIRIGTYSIEKQIICGRAS